MLAETLGYVLLIRQGETLIKPTVAMASVSADAMDSVVTVLLMTRKAIKTETEVLKPVEI